MTSQKQSSFKVNDNIQNHLAFSTFTVPIKVGSPELDFLIAEIAHDAEERRITGNGTYPYYAMDLIKQSRLGALRLPVEIGGSGASIRDLFYVVIRLAEVDPDVAHILRAHYLFVEEFISSSATKERDTRLGRVAEGEIFGNAITELSSHAAGSHIYDTTLSPDGEGYRLNGTKYFSTGTLYADWVAVRASTQDGLPVIAIIPTDREGVILEDDWDGIGQKLTGSGTTRLNNVFVNSDEVLTGRDASQMFGSFPQLYLHAIIAGILRNVVADAKTLVHRRSRTFSHAAADTAAADPQLQQIVGQISSSAFAAEAIVLAAADAQDAAVNSKIDGEIDFSLNHDASLKAAQAKVIVEDLAFKASTLLFEVGGASATKQSANLDRHWCNIRTLASHNPTVYKARAIGNYIVNGTQLPLNRYF
ncbi:alkylation response protein AidB-like acyl-CoA dehydrogenase [Bacillus fengqiuensis]|nr:alkylation response protein AidB-like acyl-CoA dehydrogenase [Bacillus fengqiuensis]